MPDLAQYNIFSLIFTWFSLANIWLTFSIIIDLLPDQGIVIFGGNNTLGQEIVCRILRPSSSLGELTGSSSIDALD